LLCILYVNGKREKRRNKKGKRAACTIHPFLLSRNTLLLALFFLLSYPLGPSNEKGRERK